MRQPRAVEFPLVPEKALHEVFGGFHSRLTICVRRAPDQQLRKKQKAKSGFACTQKFAAVSLEMDMAFFSHSRSGGRGRIC